MNNCIFKAVSENGNLSACQAAGVTSLYVNGKPASPTKLVTDHIFHTVTTERHISH